ncbi:MAG: hypothetical protein ACKO18_07960, partial [Bacteroidota bacterium]
MKNLRSIRFAGPCGSAPCSWAHTSLLQAISLTKGLAWACTWSMLAACNQEGMLGLDLLPENNRFPTITDSVELVGSTVME